MCDDGFASMSSLLNKFASADNVYVPNLGDNAQACVNCSTSVVWRHSDSGLLFQEALKCSTSKGIEMAPHQFAFFSQEKQDWATCTKDVHGVQSIPTANKTGCFACEPGKYYGLATREALSYTCLRCPTQTFQDLRGQTACKPKRIFCDKGFMISINYDSYTMDNDCSKPCPTECEEGQITIMALNKSLDNGDTCDGKGNSFFGCYDGNGRGLGLNASARLVYKNGGNSVSVQFCDARLLPPNAEWVSYSRPNGAECYFACQYGLNEAISSEFRRDIQNYVYSQRQDLKDFLISGNGFGGGSSSSSSSSSSILVDTNWQINIDYTPEDLVMYGGGGMGWSLPSRWTNDGSVSGGAFLTNTFLFIDEVMLKHRANMSQLLCLSRQEAYGSKQCIRGFTRPENFFVEEKTIMCALQARSSFYRITENSQQQAQAYAVVSPSSRRQICESETGSLSSFRVGCSINCLDLYLDLAYKALSKLIPDSIGYRRLSWIWHYLQRSSWQDYGNPYFFRASSCDFTCENTRTFRYSTSDHQRADASEQHAACIPIDIAASTICSLFDPPRFVSAYSVPSGNSELTVREVCTTCAQTKNNAVLISGQSLDYAKWWDVRVSIFGSNLETKNAWENIQCR